MRKHPEHAPPTVWQRPLRAPVRNTIDVRNLWREEHTSAPRLRREQHTDLALADSGEVDRDGEMAHLAGTPRLHSKHRFYTHKARNRPRCLRP